MRTSLCAGLILSILAGQANAATITDLGTDGLQLLSLSTHGHIASGIIGQSGAWRWTEASGATSMAGFVSSLGMNSYAQPIVGAYSPDNSTADAVAAMYYSNTPIIGTPVVLGGFPGTGGGTGQGISTPYGVSDTGVVVGLAYSATNLPIAFSWSAAQGWTQLTVNRPNKYSRANGISRDGRVIFGWNDQTTGYRSGVIWRDGVPLDLTDASGNPVGEALAASADGSVVVGYNYSTANGQEAWRWTAQTGVVPLGVMAIAPAGPTKLAPRIKLAMQQQQNVPEEQRDVRMPGPDGFFPPTSYAFAVSADGQTIVGATGIPPTRKAVIWTQAGGMELLSDYAAARGVTLPPTIPSGLASANAISADGLTIGGIGFGASNYRAYIADFHDDSHPLVQLQADGIVDYNDLTTGPFAGVAAGRKVSMTFLISPNGTVIAAGQDTAYPISLGSFVLRAGNASETLQPTQNGVNVNITNDYPKSDGIHLFSTPTHSGQAFEFELFNPGGNLFDSTDVNRVNRTFGPELFEKIAWDIQDGNRSMTIDLQSVTLKDVKLAIGPHH